MQASEPVQPPGVVSRTAPIGRLTAMIVTGLLAFALTYASAWTAMRRAIVFGDSDMRFGEARNASLLIVEFHKEKGRYPDSLDELRRHEWPEKSFASRADQLETLGDRLRYQRADKSFTLELLERDGKAIAMALDCDLDGDPRGHIRIDREPSRFLFEGMYSGTLFLVACGVSLAPPWHVTSPAGRTQGSPHWPSRSCR